MARKELMPKVRSGSHVALRDVALERIRDLIVSGSIAPGERLVEEALGQRLGMSRNPVRESLKILEREGFVTISPYRGAVVSQIGRKEAMDIFEIRELLDSFAAAQAARMVTEADLEQLQSILSAGTRALAEGDFAELAAHNGRFHAKVHAMSGNAELIHSLERLRLKVAWMFAGYAPTRGEAAWNEHAALVDAIANGDAERAAESSKLHVARSRTAYLDLLGEPAADGVGPDVDTMMSTVGA
jgi:DNA-binding GntR family transcriptional regulator